MRDSERLRDRAARVLALALDSRESGFDDYSDKLTEQASEILADAEQIERRSGRQDAFGS